MRGPYAHLRVGFKALIGYGRSFLVSWRVEKMLVARTGRERP